MPIEKKTISIFDLDGTLSKKDTYLPYLLGFLMQNPRRWLKAVALPFAVMLFYLKIRTNEWLKEFFLELVFGGERKSNIEKWNRIYLDKLLKSGMRRDILDLLMERQKAGDIVIIATASLDIYVNDVANALNINHVICTGTQSVNNILTGKLSQKNCYGLEKLIRVKQYLEENNLVGEIHAYSDHSSDLPLLGFANIAFAVYPTPKLRILAQQANIQIIDANP
jgi:phosphatidylglycerophosphatase C